MSFARENVEAPPRRTTAAVLIVAVAGFLASSAPDRSALSRIAMGIGDPARTVVLLSAAAALAPISVVATPLAWLGRNSWEIYVGQMAAHSLGYSAWCRMGGPVEHRVPYALVLLACSVAFAVVYSELRRRISGRAAPA